MKKVKDIHEYTINSMQELRNFIEMYKDDKELHYYYGDIDCFNGEYYTLDDLAADACDEWFEDGAIGYIYEFDFEEEEEETE